EGVVDVPARAGAAEARDADARGAEALGDVAGDVDAQQVEGNALGAGTPQGGEAVADLLEAGPEAQLQDLDVVARLARRLENPLIGHQHGAGEIIGEGGAGELVGGEAGELAR